MSRFTKMSFLEKSSSNEILIKPDETTKPNSIFFSVRFLLTCLIFLAAGTQYMQKIDMGVAIVCMVNSTESKNDSNPNLNDTDTCLFKPSNVTKQSTGKFNWHSDVQGFVLSSYFYGYALTQIISGWLSLRFGGKNVLGFSMIMGSVMTLLAAPSAELGYGYLIACRFINGLVHGLVWPAISDIFIRWVPVAEKSRLIGFASAGNNLGNIIALPLGTYLCVDGFAGGWPSIFYIYGIIGVVWFILFMTLTSNSPQAHKFISEREKAYILANTDSEKKTSQKKIKKATPWYLILTSKPCIAIYFGHFSANWGNYLFLTELPTFMNDILKFDIKSNGLYSSFPYIAWWSCAITSGFISDKLIDSKLMARGSVRKLFNSMGLFVALVATVALVFVDCSNPYAGLALLTIGVGSIGCTTGAGYIISINEVGGIYSGVLFGISNTFGTIPGIVAPYIVSVLTSNKLQSEWRIVFIITAVVYLIGGSLYLLLIDGQPQPWGVREDVEGENNKINQIINELNEE